MLLMSGWAWPREKYVAKKVSPREAHLSDHEVLMHLSRSWRRFRHPVLIKDEKTSLLLQQFSCSGIKLCGPGLQAIGRGLDAGRLQGGRAVVDVRINQRALPSNISPHR